jgi:hypothetical protein
MSPTVTCVINPADSDSFTLSPRYSFPPHGGDHVTTRSDCLLHLIELVFEWKEEWRYIGAVIQTPPPLPCPPSPPLLHHTRSALGAIHHDRKLWHKCFLHKNIMQKHLIISTKRFEIEITSNMVNTYGLDSYRHAPHCSCSFFFLAHSLFLSLSLFRSLALALSFSRWPGKAAAFFSVALAPERARARVTITAVGGESQKLRETRCEASISTIQKSVLQSFLKRLVLYLVSFSFPIQSPRL